MWVTPKPRPSPTPPMQAHVFPPSSEPLWTLRALRRIRDEVDRQQEALQDARVLDDAGGGADGSSPSREQQKSGSILNGEGARDRREGADG